VRKAIALAYPYDQTYKAAGLNDYVAEKASTILPPSVPGYTKYTPQPGLNGTGAGDPAAAKAALTAAGKAGFQLSWYYDNTQPIPQQVNQIKTQALQAAGFKVKAIGVATADLRSKLGDYDAPVNMGQSPSGWCSDWPTGGSWFPVLFQSHSLTDRTSWGMMSDKALDSEINAVGDLPTDQATGKWAAIDQEIMGRYVVLPLYYSKMANVEGTGLGGAEGDGTMGVPFFVNMYVKS
jgi:peptide/nickel transport system substrate-binding protein